MVPVTTWIIEVSPSWPLFLFLFHKVNKIKNTGEKGLQMLSLTEDICVYN